MRIASASNRNSRPVRQFIPSGFAVVSAAVSLLALPVLSSGPLTAAISTAAPCPDVEVVFARGRDEPPGVGQVGQAFVDALQERTGRDVRAYAVAYPAQTDPAPGVGDMAGHIRSMVANCPDTRLVVGGYSLGGAVTNAVLNGPLPPGADQHIAAVATFGNASRLVNTPLAAGPAYGDKTIEMCNPGDPICSGGPFAPSHLQVAYIASGAVNAAADFTAAKL